MEIHRIILFFATMVALLGMFFSTSFTTSSKHTNLQPLNLTGCNDLRFETANATSPDYMSTETPSNASLRSTVESKIRTGCSFKILENLDEKESKLVYDMFLLLNPTDKLFADPIPWSQENCYVERSILVDIMYGAKRPSITTSIGNKTEAYKSILNLFAHLSCLSDKINMCIDMYEVDHAASVKALDYILRNRERVNRLLINDFKAINWDLLYPLEKRAIVFLFQRAYANLSKSIGACKDKHPSKFSEYDESLYLEQSIDGTTFCKILIENYNYDLRHIDCNDMESEKENIDGY